MATRTAVIDNVLYAPFFEPWHLGCIEQSLMIALEQFIDAHGAEPVGLPDVRLVDYGDDHKLVIQLEVTA